MCVYIYAILFYESRGKIQHDITNVNISLLELIIKDILICFDKYKLN